MKRKTTKTPAKIARRIVNRRPAFLAAFRECANVSEAAAAAKIDRHRHYEWLAEDAAYAEMFERARGEAAQTLEDEAVTRAKRGVFEPLVYQGTFSYPQVWDAERERFVDDRTQPPLGVWKKSDGLMQFLLRGFMPHKYRQGVEITGANGGAIATALTVTFVKPGAGE